MTMRTSPSTQAKRLLLLLLLALVVSVSTASLASASPVRSAPHPLRPANECQTTKGLLTAHSNWTYGGPGFELYAQAWELVDYYSGNYCGYDNGVVGIEFFGSNQCLRLYAQLGGDDILGHWSGWYINHRDVCGSYPQTFWVGTGYIYAAGWCNEQVMATNDQNGNYAYTIYNKGC